jgi:hypothetical protein
MGGSSASRAHPLPDDQADDQNCNGNGSKTHYHFEYHPHHFLGVLSFKHLGHHRESDCQDYEHYECPYRAYNRFCPVCFFSSSHWFSFSEWLVRVSSTWAYARIIPSLLQRTMKLQFTHEKAW